MNAPAEFKLPEKIAGYRTFMLGEFTFQRDEYFVTITWPARGMRQSHTMSADAFLFSSGVVPISASLPAACVSAPSLSRRLA